MAYQIDTSRRPPPRQLVPALKNPALVGTSNVRQGDRFGMVRSTKQPYHTPEHSCCNVVDRASLLSITSIPGLALRNMVSHTVPIYPRTTYQNYGGLTLRSVIERVAVDPSFNGHLCLWLLDNDIDWIYQRRDSIETAVEEYKNILGELFQGIHLERLYLTTAPFRKSDFDFNQKLKSEPKVFRRKFNAELRKVFGGGNIKIESFPITLLDLNVVFPEHSLSRKTCYCQKEFLKVHYNAVLYSKFLDYLYDILRSHGGLESHSLGIVAKPTLSLPVATLSSLSCGDKPPHVLSSLPSSLQPTAVPFHTSIFPTHAGSQDSDRSSLSQPPQVPLATSSSALSLLRSSERTVVPIMATTRAQDSDKPSLSNASTPVEAGPSMDPLDDSEGKPVDNTKIQKTARRGKRNRDRRFDPFLKMRLDYDLSD